MLAWKITDDEDSAISKILKSLPYDITEVSGDDVLSKIVCQSVTPPYATVLLHSTAALSDRYAQVHGSTGTAARQGASAGSAEQENELSELLYSAFERLLTQQFAVEGLPSPSWGPTLHRWGGAFPHFTASRGDPTAWTLQDASVSFAGDFLAPPYGCVETSLASGMNAAREFVRLQTARFYVDRANQHDRA